MWRRRTEGVPGGWWPRSMALLGILSIASCMGEPLDSKGAGQTWTAGRFAPRKLLQTDADWDMWTAALLNDTDEFFAALAKGADVNVSLGSEGACPCSVLVLAADAGNLPIVTALIDAGADLDATTAVGNATATFAAAQKGHTAIVRALADAGADLDRARSGGASPLMVAAEKGRPGVVEALLSAGADPAGVDDAAQTALHMASLTIGEESVAIAVALMDAGADIEAQDADSWTPLIWAVHFGNAGTLGVLLDGGANRAARDASGDSLEDHICRCPAVAETEGGLACPAGGCDSGAADAIAEMLRS